MELKSREQCLNNLWEYSHFVIKSKYNQISKRKAALEATQERKARPAHGRTSYLSWKGASEKRSTSSYPCPLFPPCLDITIPWQTMNKSFTTVCRSSIILQYTMPFLSIHWNIRKSCYWVFCTAYNPKQFIGSSPRGWLSRVQASLLYSMNLVSDSSHYKQERIEDILFPLWQRSSNWVNH